MEFLFEFDNMKAEIAKAIRSFNQLRSIACVFRTLEVALALIILFWIFNRVPFAVRISGEFFRQFACVVASPLFVFALCNLIIVALIAKSREINQHNAETELYEEVLRNSAAVVVGDRSVVFGDRSVVNNKSAAAEETNEKVEEDEVVYQDKQIIGKVNTCPLTAATIDCTCEDDVADNNPPVYRRRKSEKLEVMRKSTEKVFRLSETEKCGKDLSPAVAEESLLFPEDEMSNEEFQRTIEDFIAKQMKFRRQESVSTPKIRFDGHCCSKSELNIKDESMFIKDYYMD